MVKAIPDGFHTITPYLTVADLSKQIAFIEQAFGGKVTEAVPDDEGHVQHAEMQIGDSKLMLGQARGEWQPRPGTLYLYVEDTDKTYERALAAGGTSLMEPADQFYGDRNAGVSDPQGNWWWIATHIEDVSPEKMK
ncbi:MAG TPA: VOC family protein [Thermoanaerobaculia bacterium]|nr:VOC family protein [Thermoanaerobaculia bacterium]